MLSKELSDTIASDEQFGFLLVRQKDHIINLISDRKFQAARAALTTVIELWTICGYKYKYDELISRIRIQDKRMVEPND